MTERKRRKVTDTRRLVALAGELVGVGAAIAQCGFRETAPRALPLRPTPATSSLAAAPLKPLPPSTTASSGDAGAAVPSPAPRSLFSLVSTAAYTAKETAASRREGWQVALRRVAGDLAKAGDAEPTDRVERLMRRHESLEASVRVLEERLKRPTDEVALNDRVESQLEREEKEWEAQMQVREQAVAELEVELKALRDEDTATEEDEDEDEEEENDDGADSNGEDSEEQDESGGEEKEGEDEAERRLRRRRRREERDEQALNEAEHVQRELREALALREEEKHDIESAIDSLRRKKRRRTLPDDEGENEVESDRSRQLQRELAALRQEKEALQREILDAEARSEQLDEHKSELPALKADITARKRERAELTERVDMRKLQLARLKDKMRHMVDVQMLSARDTSPPTLREEAVLLHLLYEHAGELGVNELKQATAAVMAEHDKPPNSAAVIRALYSLVANGIVQIDRSYGNGLVTSLLV